MNDTPDSLRALLGQAFERHETSGRQLGLMARDRGFSVTGTTINQIRSGTYHSVPSPDTVRAIAWLAGVPESVAFTAAGQTVPGPPLGEELPPGADNLPPKARKAVIEYTRVLIDQQEQIRELTQQLEQAAGPASERSGGGAPARAGARAGQKISSDDQWTYTIEHVTPAREDADQESGAEVPEDFALAAHPEMELARDRFEAEHGDAGEEEQKSGHDE